MRLITLLLIIIFSHHTFAQSVKEKLENLGAKCEGNETILCILPEKALNYPNKVIILFYQNEVSQNVWLHLHGHSLGKLSNGEDFDSSPEQLVKSFHLPSLIANQKNAILIIPFTHGRCHDYDHYLVAPKNFENFIDNIQNVLPTPLPLHLSAHSGGGRTLAKTINKIKQNIQSITLFDANYHMTNAQEYTTWVNRPAKQLNLVTVAPKNVNAEYQKFTGATPFNIAKIIFETIELNKQRIIIDKEESFVFSKDGKSKTLFIYQAMQNPNHHWHIVTDFFPLMMEKTISNLQSE
jgi:hypothetical protein